jgi:ribosome biogenesis GTPase
VVTSLNLDFKVRRIERYLALVYESGARPAIVLTKADLCGEPDPVRREAVAVAPDVPVLVTSAVSGAGMAELKDLVRSAGTSALLGSSGVGKSALINAMLGSDIQRLMPVREHDDRGRHATTSRQLFSLPGGGIVIDTPGMRELRLWDAEDGLLRAFEDIEALGGTCRFRDCAHDTEPGCAVTLAVAEGRLPSERLDSYRRLQREERFWQTRHDEGSRIERDRRERLLSKAQRDVYKRRGE